MKIKDRIKDFRRVKASELKPNPKNWRKHPQSQRDAMTAALSEIGFAGAQLCRELPDGSLELIDGHLRAEVSGDADIPVLVLDVTEQEADKILLTFDPLSAMAETENRLLAELVESVEFDSASLRKMIDDMDAVLEDDEELLESVEDAGNTDDGMVDVDKMELQPDEHYDFILVLADNVNDWNRLVALLQLPEVCLSRTHRRIGLGRAVRAEKVLRLIDEKQA